MRRSSCTLAILLILVAAIGTAYAQPWPPTVNSIIAEANQHFAGSGTLGYGWDEALSDFQSALNLAIATNDIQGQIDIINALLTCSDQCPNQGYAEKFGQNARDLFLQLWQSSTNTDGTVISAPLVRALAGLPPLGPNGLNPVVIPSQMENIPGWRRGLLELQGSAANALNAPAPVAAGAGRSLWYCPCNDGAVFNDELAFDAHWNANHPYGCDAGAGGSVGTGGSGGAVATGWPTPVGTIENSWWYCPCGDGFVFSSEALFNAHWNAAHPFGRCDVSGYTGTSTGGASPGGSGLIPPGGSGGAGGSGGNGGTDESNPLPEDNGVYNCYCCGEEFPNLEDLLNHENEGACYDPRYM